MKKVNSNVTCAGMDVHYKFSNVTFRDASYSLLAPRSDDTGQDDPSHSPLGRHLGLRGNRTLKWAFIEAAHGAVPLPTDGTPSRGISFNNSTPNTEGTLLAVISDASADTGPAGSMVIAEWPAGAMLTHDGGAGTDALVDHVWSS